MALMVSKRTYQKISPTYIHTICTIILALALKNVQVKKYLQLKLVAAKNNKNVENVSEIHLTTAAKFSKKHLVIATEVLKIGTLHNWCFHFSNLILRFEIHILVSRSKFQLETFLVDCQSGTMSNNNVICYVWHGSLPTDTGIGKRTTL